MEQATTSMQQLAAIKDHLRRHAGFTGKTVEQIRSGLAAAAAGMPQPGGIDVEPVAVGTLRGEWVRARTAGEEQRAAHAAENGPDDDERTASAAGNGPDNDGRTASAAGNVPDGGGRAVLYFHGGGFVAGSCALYRDLAGRVAAASGDVPVLTVEYRLAPEHPYPAANEDCLEAYRWLLARGYSPGGIVFGGDSVGGSLALMTLLALRDSGEAPPAGAFLLSPHTDLVHLDGESYRSRAALDPMGSMESSRRILEAYAGGPAARMMPAILSPLRMDLRGLPRLFVQVGDHEVLLSDATRLADRARAAGVDVALEVWEQMWSGFQLLAHMLPEAQRAVANVGRFVAEVLDRGR